MDAQTKNYIASVKKLPKSMVEISVKLSGEAFDGTRAEALKRIASDAEYPGFRRGHVPENIIIAKTGEAHILEEMAEIAISKAYADIIIGEKLDVIGRPEVRITKVAPGNPLEFTIVTAIFPEVTLPDYKKLAAKEVKKEEKVAVEEKELEQAIDQLRKMRAEKGTGETTDAKSDVKEELPPLDDAFVKTIGNFANVDDFREKLRANILSEKERAAKEKKRVTIIESIIAGAKIDLPDIIIEQELSRMEAEFENDVKRMGLTLESYLKAVNKTKEEAVKEWKPEAEKRAKVQLAVSKIAEEEKIVPEKEEVEQEIAGLKARYDDVSEERIRGFVEMMLTNEKVFRMLESQK